LTLERLFAGRNIDVDQMMNHLRRKAKEFGLSFGDRKMTYNSRRAHELGKWADAEGKGDPFHKAVFEAYFVRGQNIATLPVLIDIAKSVGLSGDDAGQVVEKGYYKGAVDEDWKRSYENGIQAVPTFLLKSISAVGAQTYKSLEQLLLKNDVKERA
jgi:predicted DsbA family dithiol-disulfide isomerase